jgi:peptide/nickel transport system permease protein
MLVVNGTGVLQTTSVSRRSQFIIFVKRFLKNRWATINLFVLLSLVVIAILAPWITPYDYTFMDFSNMFAGPSFSHPFGADELGRDILSRIIYGSRYSLGIGLLSVSIALVLGVILGSLAGYFGGMVDIGVMRILDVLQSIPGILLAIAISAALGPGFLNTALALAVGMMPMIARLLRGSILSIRTQEYVEAAVAVNCSTFRIIFKHILPNSFAPVLVAATMSIGNAILTAAGLSFIGLGIQPPTPEWGAMLSAGRDYIREYPHLVLFPGVFIMMTVLAFNVVGDALRDFLDPKLKD